MANNIHKRVIELYRTLSKGQKRVANLILHHYDSIAYNTSKQLATKAGVSESTVIRFAHFLGYPKYSDFQHAIQDILRLKSTRLDNITRRQCTYPLKDLPDAIFKADISDIRRTSDALPSSDFSKFVTEIINAKSLYIISSEESWTISNTLREGLRYCAENVVSLTNLYSDDTLLALIDVGSDDVVIVIDYPPHTKRLLALAEHLSDHTDKILVLTDTKDSPIARLGLVTIVAKNHSPSLTNSSTALISLANAIISETTRRNESAVISRLERVNALKDKLNNHTRGLL